MTDGTDGAQSFAVRYVPTLRERFWRKLGFRFHLGDDPDDGRESMPGWMITQTTFHFSITDRLRLLVTGRLRTRTVSYIDTPTPAVVKNRVDWQIYAPGEPR